MKRGIHEQSRGMTLMETVVATGVVGIVIPLILAAVGLSLESSRKAREDTRAAMMACEVFEEIPYLWGGDEEGLYFGLDEKNEDFPEVEDRWLSFDSDGNFLKALSADEGEGGVFEGGSFYVVKVDGEEHLEGPSGVLSKVVVEVQAPAQIPEERRRLYTFVRLFN
jgi:hypothetical protein